MSEPAQKNVTSIDALLSTIRTDTQTYRWFTFAVLHPSIQSQIIKTTNTNKLYAHLKQILIYQRLAYMALTAFCGIAIASKNNLYFGLCLLLIYPLTALHNRKKNIIVHISQYLLSQDFDSSTIAQKTLYQISEFYAKRYNIPSLIDIISHYDRIVRNTILLSILIAGIIYPFNWGQIILTAAASCFLIYGLIGTQTIYKKLK